MSKKKKLFQLPDFLENTDKILDEPLKILDDFNEMVQSFDNKIKQFDSSFSKFDSVLVNPVDLSSPASEPMHPPATPKNHSHLSYEEQSDLDYCIECGLKHSQTAKVLLREAIQRAQRDNPSTPGVQEKVRGAIEELCGFEDDTTTVENKNVALLNTLARDLRKFIYMSGAEVGNASLDNLQEIKSMTDKLVDATYQVKTSEGEECIACEAEEICGANIECAEFIMQGIKNVKSADETKKILKQAKQKYGRD